VLSRLLSYIRDYFTLIFIIIVGIIIGILITNRGCRDKIGLIETNTIYIHDTLLVNKYITQVQVDTTIKWLEKIVLIKERINPDTVYIHKTDSVFKEYIKYLDKMLEVKRTNDLFEIYTFSDGDTVLKKYIYHSNTHNFNIVAQKSNVSFVEINRPIYWEGINIGYGIDFGIDERRKPNIELSSGISFYSRLHLDIFAKSYGQFGIKAYYNWR